MPDYGKLDTDITAIKPLERYPPDAPSPPRRRSRSLAWFVLAVSLLITTVIWRATLWHTEQSHQAQLDRAASRVRDSLLDRIDQFRQTLESVHMSYRTVGRLEPDQWASYLESLNLDTTRWGLHPLLLVRDPSRGASKGSSEPDREKSETPPNSATPAASVAAVPAELVIIGQPKEDAIPSQRLAALVGSKQLRQTIELARSSGRLAFGPVAIIRSPAGVEVGFWAVLPVVGEGEPASKEEPEASLRSWLTAFVPAGDLMRGLAPIAGPSLDAELFDVSKSGKRSLLYDGDGLLSATDNPYATDLRSSISLHAGGRTWTLFVSSPPPSLAPLAENLAEQVLLGGLAVSFFMFCVVLIVDRKRSKAERAAGSLAGRLRDRDTVLHAVFDDSADGFLTFNEDELIESFSVGAEKLFDYRAGELVRSSIRLLFPDGIEEGSASSPPSEGLPAEEQQAPPSREISARRKDGARFPVEVTVRRVDLGGRAVSTATVRDLSRLKLAEQGAREAEQRYTLFAHATNDGLWEWDLLRESISLSARWKAMLGYSEDEIGNSPNEWFERVHLEDRDTLRANLATHLEERSDHFECEHRILHRDGSYRWMLTRGITVRQANGRALRILGSQTDITARKRAERRLVQAALHDPLTGLPNRSYFMERLEHASNRVRKHPDRLFALLFLDVDRFKFVNDGLGHLAGDELLISIARRLTTCVRPGDTIARLGGDEFAILIESLSDVKEATVAADRIQKSLALPHEINDEEIFIAVSIGIALSSATHEKAGDLFRNADSAMYRAKARGKARYELFDQDMRSDATRNLHLETALRRALERGELLLHYQPIVSLVSGEVTSCEALMRWQHPERGMILPREFIPAAEETGLINALSAWLLRTACSQARAWHAMGLPPIRVSVNVSPQCVQAPGFFDAVTEALAESNLDPALLQLELTESALMEHADSTVRPLVELYTRGVQISLDDFGTGYSSLVYLRRYPISALKIDESLVREITTDPGDAAIASGLIALAHSLDLKVIVEGVETREQLAFLQSKKCDEMQGYIISPPLDVEAFAALLRERRTLDALLARRAAAHG